MRIIPFGTLAGNPYNPSLTLVHDRDIRNRGIERDGEINRCIRHKPPVLYSFGGAI